ncbi:vacuole effluxer Atg22 like protein [Nitzschia inconspicua]|uniref:Vacuole effluxer Atg22 like protein n=1 Tax=Nitzschia inconspicua TaxID=303405 RepID=A0A9K3KAJ2_9STRA|nr:vacuole effluxer Atg22 like protein [Nitzschia inconspicua]
MKFVEPMRAGAVPVETREGGDPTRTARAASEKEEDISDIKLPRKYCGCFLGNEVAIAYNILGMGRGSEFVSNVYLAGSLIYLACKESGGVDPITNECDDSNLTVHGGMKPSSLISNIAIISGLLSAFLMPVYGAIVDYTNHRKLMGIISMMILAAIRCTQIATIENTWFPMAILQAFAGFIYQVQNVSCYAYLPELAREVGQERMNNYTAVFTQTQFGSQAVLMIMVTGISFGLSLSTVQTAMVSQAGVFLWCVVFFPWGWKYLPARPARHDLKDGQWLITAGFAQNWNKAKDIWTKHRKGLKWYFLALIFAEASVSTITNVSIIYLTDVVGLSITQIGIFFLLALLGSIPGTNPRTYSCIIAHKTNPNTSWKLSLIFFMVTSVIGAFAFDDMKAPKELSYIWGTSLGILLGWFISMESLFFSMCLPQGQEAEMAGFFIYCSQILTWVPALIFTVLVQSNVHQKYGIISTSFGFLIALLFLSCTGTWDEILAEAGHSNKLVPVGDDVNQVDASDDLPTSEDGTNECETDL